MVPLDEKGKLNCRALLGGSRYRLSQLQDDFALAMKPLGLSRGIKGSRASHTEVRKYYAAINQQPDANLDIQTMQQLVADRLRAINDSAQMEQTALALARELERKEKLISELKRQAEVAEQVAQSWQKKYQELADKVR
jgi:hypothetical protein